MKITPTCKSLISLFSLFVSLLFLTACLHDDSSSPAATYGIGGTVSGLSGTVVLQNNGGSDLTMTGNGDFSFGTEFADGASYAVTVLTSPTGQGCLVSNSSGSVSGATVSNISVSCANHADLTGYYDNGGLFVTDLTDETTVNAMIQGSRIMLLSTGNQLLYDGTMTISGISFTTTATIYKNGSNIGTTNIAGSIVGANVSGEMTSTADEGQGTFTLTYADTNNQIADFANIETSGSFPWKCDIGESGGLNYGFDLNGTNSLLHQQVTGITPFAQCQMSGTVTNITNTRLFTVSTVLSGCDPDSGQMTNSYTGFATGGYIRDGSNYQELFFAMANGDYAVYSKCTR